MRVPAARMSWRILPFIVFPGVAESAFISASPDPIDGNKSSTETVCYYDGNNRPIPNFDINFAFNLVASARVAWTAS